MTIRTGLTLLTCLLIGVPASLSQAADLTLTIQDGRVTLIATGVSLEEILEEWARVGETQIVNGDQLAGPILTLEMRDVPEAQALATLLRSASGYLVAPRPQALPNLSRYDRILILASSQAPPAPGPSVGGGAPAYEPPAPGVPGTAPGFPTGNPYQVQAPDGGGVEEVSTPSQPATGFNYANPAQLRRPTPAAPASFGPQMVPGGGQSAPRPGMIVEPPPPPPQPVMRNPYGLPDNVVPGSQPAPPQEPDRSKYTNPVPEGDSA